MAKQALSKPIQVPTKDLIGPLKIDIDWEWDVPSQSFVPSTLTARVAEGAVQNEEFIQLGSKVVSIRLRDMPAGLKTALDQLADQFLQKVIQDEYHQAYSARPQAQAPQAQYPRRHPDGG